VVLSGGEARDDVCTNSGGTQAACSTSRENGRVALKPKPSGSNGRVVDNKVECTDESHKSRKVGRELVCDRRGKTHGHTT
jgi:hypothetical protein